MANDAMQQQQTHQIQQYKNHIQTHTARKRILLVSSEDDVNLALKMALEEEEQDGDKSYIKHCWRG
jgi:hypothetical protein